MRASTSAIVLPGAKDGGSSATQAASSAAASETVATPCCDVMAILLRFLRARSHSRQPVARRSADRSSRRHEQRIILAAGRTHPACAGVKVDVEDPIGTDRDLIAVGPDLLAEVAVGDRLTGASEHETYLVARHSGLDPREVLPGQRLRESFRPIIRAERHHVGGLP